MTVLLVISGLLLVLVVTCIRESRSGRPAWGAHLDSSNTPSTRSAASAAKKSIAATVTLGAVMGIDGGDG